MYPQTRIQLGVLGLIALFLFNACKKEDAKGVIRVEIQHQFNGKPLQLFTQKYLTKAGDSLNVEKVKYFIDEITLVDHDGGITHLDQTALIDVEANRTSFDLTVPIKDYQDIQFVLGVSKINNHQDPKIFPIGSVLNATVHSDMHWEWNPGYIFMKLEGRYRKENGTPSTYFYHIGLDKFATPVEFKEVHLHLDHAPSKTLVLAMNLDKFFNSPNAISLNKNEDKTHSVGDTVLVPRLAKNMMGMMEFVEVR